MSASTWHRAAIEAERDLSAYFARWSRVHPPVPYQVADAKAAARLIALTIAAMSELGGAP